MIFHENAAQGSSTGRAGTVALALLALALCLPFGLAAQDALVSAEQLRGAQETFMLNLSGPQTLEAWQDYLQMESVFKQQQRLIGRVSASSYFLPGTGHFMLGEAGSGTLFLLGDITIQVGSILLVNLVLPPNVQLHRLDYFGTPFEQIQREWSSLSFESLLPAIGVGLGTAVLHMLYVSESARSARQLAAEKIDSGQIRFEPQIGIDAQARPHFGFSFFM